jgi:hypothetical protein
MDFGLIWGNAPGQPKSSRKYVRKWFLACHKAGDIKN